MHLTRLTLAVCAAVVIAAPPAHAQLTRSGSTFFVGGTTIPTIYPDVAFDPTNNRYLAVAGNGFIEGQLIAASGGVIRTFTINAGRATGQYAQTPRVAYSPDIAGGGGYLVTWHASFGFAPADYTSVVGRILSADGTPLTGDFVIGAGAPRASTHWIMGADIAYSTASHEFLVVWMGNYFSTQDIFFTRVNPAGTVLQSSTRLGPGTADWERDPSVAYNPDQDEFYVLWSGYVDAGQYGYSAGQRVKAGTGALLGGTTELHRGLAMRVTSIAYNSTNKEYLAAWHTSLSSGQAVYGATIAGDSGAVRGGIKLLSSYYAAYDALDLDYNARSGDYALVTHGRGAEVWEDAVVPIAATGSAIDNGFIATHTLDVRALRPSPESSEGNFNPRIVASANEKKWLLVTSNVFKALHGQFVQSSSTSGTPSTPTTPTTPTTPAVSRPAMVLDSPVANASIAGTVAVMGWAIDLGSTSGPGVDRVDVWAFPTSGAAATFLGSANTGTARPDVAAAYGNSRYASAGFSLVAAVAPGSYYLVAYAHSTVSGTFNNERVVPVTMTAPPSNPRMNIDLPGSGQNISQNFRVTGWAIDLTAPSGPGVDLIHIWAYPSNGSPAVFLGSPALGGARPDVGSAFGSSRFSPSGFNLDVFGKIPPGDYDISVYARSTVSGTFNNVRAVHVTVR